MILGPSCSVATYLMGEIAQRKLNIPQVAIILCYIAWPAGIKSIKAIAILCSYFTTV